MTDLLSQVRRLLGPGSHIVVPLGEGVDHIAYEVDGDFVVRRQKAVDGADVAALVAREIALLDVVARVSPIPVPAVVAAAPEDGLVVLRKLAGESLLDRPAADPSVLVDQLAEFLAAIHGVPPERVAGLVEADDYPLVDHLAEVAEALPDITGLLDAEGRRAVDRFLSTTPPAEPGIRAFCHNDLGAEHLLATPDRTELTGVLDWSDAALADPAHDLGRLYRDLGPAVAGRVADRLDLPGEVLARAAFHARCALVEDLVFGVTTGDRRYADAALRDLSRTFRQVGRD